MECYVRHSRRFCRRQGNRSTSPPTSADAAVVDQLLLDALVGTVLPAQFLPQALIARAAAKRSQRGDEALDLLFSRCHLFFLWLQAGQ
ncbi:hypothetical protein XarbCFBP7610_14255 [Xanthomonas arboricola]|nr:hypothetical protein XarbCFBP7610_14255 [Xanthomonas arboricola]